MKILIVDDERLNLMIAKNLIEEHIHHCSIELCCFPEQVMSILAEDEIDVILLDIIMPKLNGIDLLKEIRKHDVYNDIQVIMLTGKTDDESFKVCFENGANDYISKPIQIAQFIARLQASIQARRNVRKLKEMYSTMTEQYNKLQEVTKQLKETQFYLIQHEKLASLGEIAAGVAHEINNPIGFVGSNLETMKKYVDKIKNLLAAYRELVSHIGADSGESLNLLEEKQRIGELEKKQKIDFMLDDLEPLINDSQEGVSRVSKIVNSLRNFARTGSENEIALWNINDIIEESLLILRNEIKYNAQLSLKLSSLPIVRCDKGQISQVLINILSNASQAIKSQQREEMGNIEVETYQEEGFVVCKISDDGPGIKPEHIGKIFDPFFTTKEVGTGTGLGLSIAYGIIKKHDGEFFVESELGKGATFIVKLPSE